MTRLILSYRLLLPPLGDLIGMTASKLMYNYYCVIEVHTKSAILHIPDVLPDVLANHKMFSTITDLTQVYTE